MTDTSDEISGAVKTALTVASLAAMVPVTLLRGVVLKDLWSWFVVPLGARPIGMAEALGLSLLLGFVTYTYVDNEDEHAMFAVVIRALLATLMAWGFGALYAHFR